MKKLYIILVIFSVFSYNVKAQETKDTTKTSETPVFHVVETMPSYPGGEDKMYRFLIENLKYPQSAKEKGIQGVVIVSFIVEKDGSISNIKVLKEVEGGCNEEAVRVVSLMSKWKPGKHKGKKVRVYFNLPIRFSLK